MYIHRAADSLRSFGASRFRYDDRSIVEDKDLPISCPLRPVTLCNVGWNALLAMCFESIMKQDIALRNISIK